jgi:hypothetical protein
MRALNEYVVDGLGLGSTDDPYEVVMHYPDVMNMAKSKIPLPKTVIHFDIDDNESRFFGLGDNIIDAQIDIVEDSDPIEETMIEYEAQCFVLELDVGIWASAESGGPTARMEAREDLDTLFSGPTAYVACHEATEGVEIQSFTGGRNLIDSINDVPIFRTVDLKLRVRVYARQQRVPVALIEEIGQEPELIIDDDQLIVD